MIWELPKRVSWSLNNSQFWKSPITTPFTMSAGSPKVRPVTTSSLPQLMVESSGGICVTSAPPLINSSSETWTSPMERSTVEPASATTLKLTPISSSLEVNKDILFSAREETTSLKSNGDLEKSLENILDPSMELQETPSKRNTSCQLPTGLPRSGLKNWKSPSCKLATTTHI